MAYRDTTNKRDGKAQPAPTHSTTKSNKNKQIAKKLITQILITHYKRRKQMIVK